MRRPEPRLKSQRQVRLSGRVEWYIRGLSLSYYDGFLPELKKRTEERSLIFAPSPKPGFEWLLDIEARPGKRSFFSIEGATSGVVGMVSVPDIEREHSSQAWNRIKPPQTYKLQRLEWNGYEGKKVAFALFQIWEDERASVLIPLRELFKLKVFKDKGNFTVKKEGREFFLVTPRGDSPITLRTGTEAVFSLL